VVPINNSTAFNLSEAFCFGYLHKQMPQTLIRLQSIGFGSFDKRVKTGAGVRKKDSTILKSNGLDKEIDFSLPSERLTCTLDRIIEQQNAYVERYNRTVR